MANIDDGLSVDLLVLGDVDADRVLITEGGFDPSSIGYEAPVGSLFLRHDSPELYLKTGAPDTGWSTITSGATDELVKTSSGDGTPGFLDTKLTAGSSITLVESGGADRTITIDTTIPISALQAEVDAIEASLGVSVNTNGTWAGITGSNFLDSSTSITDALLLLDTELAAADDDLAAVAVGLTANGTIPTTWTNVLWPVTHLENNTAVIEHSGTNSDRILIKETGLYYISFSMSFDADAGEETIEARVLIDNTTVIPGSLREASEDDEINDLSNAFPAELTAGTFLTFQTQASGTGNLIDLTSNFAVMRARGTKGAKGDPGAGTTISIKEDDVAVANTPHDTINFVDMEATDAGGGQVDVVNVFGSQYHYIESLGITTVTTTAYQEKLKLTTSSIPAGTYRVGWSFTYNHNSTGNDALRRVQLNDSTTLAEYQHEPQDAGGGFGTTGTNQKFPASGFANVTLTTGVHTVDIDLATSSAGVNTSIWDARIEFWRLS